MSHWTPLSYIFVKLTFSFMGRRTASVASSVEQPSTGRTSWGCTVGSATRSWSTTTATSQNPAGKSLKEQLKSWVQLICNLKKLAHQVFCCRTVPSPRRSLQTIKLQLVQVFWRQVDPANSPPTTKIQTEASSRVQKHHFCKCASRRVKKLVFSPRLLRHSILWK